MVYCHLDVFTTPLTIPVMRTRLPWLTMKQRPVTYFSKTLCWRLPWGLFRWGVWEYRWSHKGAEWVGKLRVDSISGDLRCHGFWILFWGWGIGLNLGRGLLLDSSIMQALFLFLTFILQSTFFSSLSHAPCLIYLCLPPFLFYCIL